MKVLLTKDIDKLGVVGDEVIVKDGYARNYLIPKKFAMEATEGALRVLEQKKRKAERIEQKAQEENEKLAETIKNASYTITMEAGEGDKLFGTVTGDMIAEILQAEGVEIDKRKIVLEEPIKALGVYDVDIKLHPKVTAQARIWVVKK